MYLCEPYSKNASGPVYYTFDMTLEQLFIDIDIFIDIPHFVKVKISKLQSCIKWFI